MLRGVAECGEMLQRGALCCSYEALRFDFDGNLVALSHNGVGRIHHGDRDVC